MNGLQIDINTGDLLVERSAAVVADASGFIAELVLRSCRGEFKEHPLLGAEAPLMLAGEPDPFWPGNAKRCSALAVSMSLTSHCRPTAWCKFHKLCR